MPIYSDFDGRDVRILLWHITESVDELINMLPANIRDDLLSKSVKSHGLMAGRAAVRCLISKAFPENPPVVSYDSDGRPSIDVPFFLSISHTEGYAALMLSPTSACGIDVERLSDRALKLAPRFMSHQELSDFVISERRAVLCWSAKESVYKIVGRMAVDFRESMRVCSVTGNDHGVLVMQCSDKLFEVGYSFIDGAVLTWTSDPY